MIGPTVLPGSAPPSSVLTTDTAVLMIWSFWFILLTTVAMRYYALHISVPPSSFKPSNFRQKERKGSMNSTTSCSYPSPLQTKTTSGIIFFILFLATVHALGTTFTIIWQERLDAIMQGTIIANGGDVASWGADVMTKGTEENSLREKIGKLGLALGLVVLTTLWAVKVVFIVLFWGVAGGLGLGERSAFNHSDKDKRKENSKQAERKKLPPTPKDRAGRGAYFALLITTVIIAISYPLLLTTHSVLGGITLGRNSVTYSLDTSLPSTYAMLPIILTGIVNIPTNFLLIIIPVLLFSALGLRRGRLRGTWVMGVLAFAVVVVSCARFGFVVAHGIMNFLSPGPEANVMSDWENVERGIDAKVWAALEVCMTGVAACGPGLRILMNKRKNSRGLSRRAKERDPEKGYPSKRPARETRSKRRNGREVSARVGKYTGQQNEFHGWNPNYGLERGHIGLGIRISDVGGHPSQQFSSLSRKGKAIPDNLSIPTAPPAAGNPQSPSSTNRPKSYANSRVSFPQWEPLKIEKSGAASSKHIPSLNSRSISRGTGRTSVSVYSRTSRISMRSRRERRGHEKLASVDHSADWKK